MSPAADRPVEGRISGVTITATCQKCGTVCAPEEVGSHVCPSPRPVENSELREALDNFLITVWSNVITPAGAQFDPSVIASRSRIEELFASLQLEKDFERDCTDLLKAEISRLRADRLTDDDKLLLRTDILTALRHMKGYPIVLGQKGLRESWEEVERQFEDLLRRISGSGSQ